MASASEPPNNLPQEATAFVGRRVELRAIEKLLAANRVLTLTGPGGIGKSRLALEVAHRQLARFAGGVWHVPIGEAAAGRSIERIIAEAMGIPDLPGAESAPLAGAFGSRPVLLVLDEVEFVAEALAELLAERLLPSAAGLRVLTTSRVPLRIAAEQLFAVPGLSVVPGAVRGADLERADAVALFTARARAVRPDFRLTDSSGPLVRELCARLEGHALAIELAAARIRHFELAELVRRLDALPAVLQDGPRDASPRHRSLDRTISWTLELLRPPARSLYPRLAVFRGGFDATAAASCAPELDPASIPAALSELLDHSLLVAEPGATETTRYRLMEPLRQHASSLLGSSGLETMTRARHAAFFRTVAEEAATRLFSAEQPSLLRAIAQDADNIRAAVDWLTETEPAAAVALAASMARYWSLRAADAEGEGLIAGALAAAPMAPARPRALLALAWAATANGRLREAADLATEAAGLARETFDVALEAEIVLLQAQLAQYDGGDPGPLLEEALRSAEASGLDWLRALVLGERADVEFMTGREAEAVDDARRALSLARRLGCPSLTFAPATVLAREAMFRHGDDAQDLWLEALAAARDLRNPALIHYVLRPLAQLAAQQGDVRVAAARLEEAAAIARRMGIGFMQVQLIESVAHALIKTPHRMTGLRLATMAAHLKGPEWIESPSWSGYARAELDGAREAAGANWDPDVAAAGGWSLDDAMLEAEREIHRLASATEPADRRSGGLSDRERQIAGLAADGLTNRQIARRLSISDRTAEAHLRHILDKLDLMNRTQLAGWVRDQPSAP